ncbi:MAG TPA: amino acid adenylation domain-containing protein, partial [Thermoanaerobaculia bacterium]|nr:amino acid adenylation domain-containing protein [Thermoanaerobaculia bacterium]
MHIALDRGPLLQGYLIDLDEWDHSLLITLHHIVGDDWSIWVLAHELAKLYSATVAGRNADLPALPLQFSDYAAWQQEWIEGAEARRQLAFWRERLASSPEVLDLPTDHPRPAVQGFRGGQIVSVLRQSDSEGLLSLALRSNATLFMALLAVLDILLYRYSGQDDLTVGAPVANRHRAGTQELIGLFTNTLVFRADLSGDPGFNDLLQQVRETLLSGLERQDFPFDRLVRELRPQRRLSLPALTQVILSFQNVPPLPHQLGPGLGLRLHELGNGISKVDLSIYLRQQEGKLVTVWEYASDLFDATTVIRMSGHFQRLLSAAVADPSRRVSELPLLTVAEQEQIAGWQGDVKPRPQGLTLQAMFMAQAARTPAAPAVIAEEGTLSYADLDERSDVLAHRLRALGVGPEVLVGLFLERSLEMVVAIFGALKAGGAYVPLDPDYPADRLSQIVGDAGIQIVLTSRRLLAALPEPHPSSILCLDDDMPVSAAVDRRSWASGAESEAGAESLAYVLFTSGSTGRPKGVAIFQRAVVNHMLWMQEEFPLRSGDRVLQKTPFGFDASVWEFYAPLIAGAALVMARPGGQREPDYLAEIIRQQNVTIFQAVPALLRAMLDDGRLKECRALRRVFCGGEALTADLERDFFSALDAELINLYGPTETTIEVTFWRCDLERRARAPLLGRPITNARVYVLSPRGELCPCGVPGEICVGGVPVGRGYLGRPEETASRFVPDPFAAGSGRRLYRTGDLGRWLPAGDLEFLGRIDHQVKVRGFRIELGEVEAAIVSHPAVADAAVLADGQRLCAYVAFRPEAYLPLAELRSFLSESLPDYMVPAVWTPLESLPYTPSGKVDRRALSRLRPEAAGDLPPAGGKPGGPIEEMLAATWAEFLGTGTIGVHDNFFDLGGHSLLATRVVSRVREVFAIELPVRRLFERPTVAALAGSIEAMLGTGGALEAPRIEPVPRSGPLPLSFAQRRLWFLDQLSPHSAVYNLPFQLRFEGRLDPRLLKQALAEVLRRHEALRTTFPSAGDEPRQAIVPAVLAGAFPFPEVDLRGLAETAWEGEVTALAAEESRRPFDLASGPLLRATLLKLGSERHVLLLTMHHIVSDGWSMEILLRELMALYAAFAAGRPSPLPELAVQYADFAVWQRRWLTGEALSRQLEHWRQRLAGAP